VEAEPAAVKPVVVLVPAAEVKEDLLLGELFQLSGELNTPLL
jgi:hypothetical protein